VRIAIVLLTIDVCHLYVKALTRGPGWRWPGPMGFAAPFRVSVTHAGTKGLMVLDQIRTVDKIRLVKRLGVVTAKTLSVVLITLQEVFAE
jgi:mRNA-degrading endonuclease toxin of MazEF toxin-antitoxin module